MRLSQLSFFILYYHFCLLCMILVIFSKNYCYVAIKKAKNDKQMIKPDMAFVC